jgi:hypothetical protein
MAVAPKRLGLTRDQFASFLQDFEQIKQFENLFAAVDTISNFTLDEINISAGNANASANEALASTEAMKSILEYLDRAPASASQEQIATLQDQITMLQQSPPALDALALQAIINASTAPVTITADFTVTRETWIINNKSGSTCTVTLPTASAYTGRTLNFQNYQDQSLVSASSNVVPQGGGSAGTAILTNVSGNWATLVSNGTNWVITQAASFNNLLY